MTATLFVRIVPASMENLFQFEPRYPPLPEGVAISDSGSLETRCPTCDKTLLLRPRTMALHLVQALREILRINYVEKRPAVVEDIQRHSDSLPHKKAGRRTMQATYTELKYWELIEGVNVPIVRENKVKNVQGWKITQCGIDFLNGEITLPERIWVYNDFARENPKREKKFISVKQVEAMQETDKYIVASESENLDAADAGN